MNEEIIQIGNRLHGLRESLDLSAEEMASACGVSVDHYLKMEQGDVDPSVYRLSKIAKKYGISLDTLLFGEDPLMSSYFLTRKGKGLCVERRKDYTYQSLAAGFKGRAMTPFMVKVDPLEGNKRFNKNSHEGQEFDMIIEGTLELSIGDKQIILNEGDSIYFNASLPHCMCALGNVPVKFLCVII